jgi:hypothetical protein
MVLSEQQIAEFIEKPFNQQFITDARKYSDRLNLHVNGVGLNKFFEQIKNYENNDQLELRKKYARSNKYLFAELLRPLDKIYTARGGAKYYSLSDGDEMKFRGFISDVRQNMSLTEWSEKVWLKKKITDPNGLIMLEISQDGEHCYPTYKSIYSIYDYQFKGSKVEYVIFEPERIQTEQGEVLKYRVVDDANDYMVTVTKTTSVGGVKMNFEVVTAETLPNYWGKVPARMVSSEEDENNNLKLSFIDAVVQIAEEILVDNSIKILFKYTHGFPAYWEIERACITCKGTGQHHGESCPSCDGTGLRKGRDISDKIIVTLDEAGKAGAIPPAGFVSTDVMTWTQMNGESSFMEQLIHKAMWGTLALMSEKVYQKATGVISDLQSVYDRLNTISNEAENMEKFMTDMLGEFYFGRNYKGSTIIYGKRFQIESPDQLLQKFRDAKSGNIPEVSVKNIYMEYIQTMYSNDPFEMSKQIKILKLDPYPIYTAPEIKNLGFSQEDVYRKIFFLQWLTQLSQDEVLFQTNEALIQSRDEYINLNMQKYANLQNGSQTN